jgi:hypothetical protein
VPAEPAGQRWKYEVHAADVSDLNIALEDRGYKPAIRYDMMAAVSLKSIVGDGKSPIELKAVRIQSEHGGDQWQRTLAQVHPGDVARCGGNRRSAASRCSLLYDLGRNQADHFAAAIDYRDGKPAGCGRREDLEGSGPGRRHRFLSRALAADDIA